MPTIRIDEDVWAWLKTNARPLEDTPNSVLRRLAGIDPELDREEPNMRAEGQGAPKASEINNKTIITVKGKRMMSGVTGQQLNDKWNVGVKHPLFHKDGTYYNHLKYFPGALFDLDGYVIFKTEREYIESPFLQHKKQLHVPLGISSMPNYIKGK